MPEPSDAVGLVDQILEDAVRRRASDVHLEPTPEGYEIRFRIDGLLQSVARHDEAAGRAAVGRLMVLAQLLTYRLDVPQEGRLTATVAPAPRPLEFRLSIMPTTHGLRAALRLPAELIAPQALTELNLPAPALDGLNQFADADAGLLLLVGPAGSGKTTTIYALLQHIAAISPGLSLITLEDPVERAIPGVTQIQVNAFGQLTYERSLRSILRHDPQVLMLGEIRDAATASLAVQAALSGHRLISTLHAADPAGAIARLFEMGLEPYQIASSLFGIVGQRLLRRVSAGGSYQGRIPVAQFARLDDGLRRAILSRGDSAALRTACQAQAGYQSLWACAEGAVARGLTDAAEIRRVLGTPEAS